MDCSWNFTNNNAPRISAGDYQISLLYQSYNYSMAIDYFFARRTLYNGDPVITVGSEQAFSP